MEKNISVTVRRACGKDIGRIADLLVQVCNVHNAGRPDIFRPGAMKYTRTQLEAILSDDMTPVLAAVDLDDVLQGYAFCIFRQTKGDNILQDMKTLYIDDICVDKAQRGKGIGRTLFAAARRLAQESGCHNLTLNVWECNGSAMQFYRSCGLEPLKTTMELRLPRP